MPALVARLIPFALIALALALVVWRGPEAVSSRSRTRLLFLMVVAIALVIVALSVLASSQP